MIVAEILVPFIVFSAMFRSIFVYLTSRNRERLAMIEKGMDPRTFNPKFNRLGIKVGLLAAGIAIGISMGQFLTHTTGMYMDLSMPSMIFLFGGLGLVLDHYLAQKEEK